MTSKNSLFNPIKKIIISFTVIEDPADADVW